MKTGLVLEGGGLRGLFTAGVMDVMMEHGVEYDGVIGVSAGATFGCNYKSRQPGRVLRYNLRFRRDPRYMGWRCLMKTGDLVGAEFSYHTLPTQLDIFDFQTYKENPTEFHVVCTDAETGEAVYKRLDEMDYDGLEWLRASASMPIVSRPVEIDGYKLLDGGIADSIPLKHFQQLGFEKCVVILTQPKDFYKKKTSLMPVFKATMKAYPRITEAMAVRHLMYNEQLAYIQEQERQGNALLIYPAKALPIGRTQQNLKRMQTVYGMGRQMGKEMLPKIQDFLK